MATDTLACEQGMHDRCFKDWCDCDCHPRKGDTRSWWLRLLYRRANR